MRASMSATGSVNLIVCFSSATRSLRTRRRTSSGLLPDSRCPPDHAFFQFVFADD
jgi:hypothetical protein